MHGRSTRSSGSLLVLLLWASPAFAGQLHVRDTTLAMMDFALLVKVLAVQKGKGTATQLRAQIERCFTKRGAESPCAVGETREFPLYGGVEWTDPGKSPIDERYWDRSATAPVAGARVLLVPASPRDSYELIDVSPARLTKFEAFFSTTPLDEVLKARPTNELRALLSDKDYLGPAMAVLGPRGELEPEKLVTLEAGFVDVLHAEWNAQRLAAQNAKEPKLLDSWIDRLLAATSTRPFATRRLVLQWLPNAMQVARPSLVPVLLSLDPLDDAQRELLSRWEYVVRAGLEAGGAAEASAYAPYVLRLVPYRPGHLDYTDLVPLTAKALSKAERASFLEKLIEVITRPPPKAVRQPFDRALFELITRALAASPDPALFDATLSLPPESWDSPQRTAFETVVKLALQMGPRDEKAHQALRAYYERATFRARYPLSVDPKLEADYLATEGWARIQGTSAPLGTLVRRRAEAEWAKRWAGANTGWSLRVSPPLPLEWPVTAKTRIASYLFAVRGSGAKLDVSAPLGRVDYGVSTPGTLEFVSLSEAIAVVRAQAVEAPPSERDADWQERLHFAYRVLSEGPPQPNGCPPELSQTLTSWSRAAAGFAAQVYRTHRDFLDSLGTDTRAFSR